MNTSKERCSSAERNYRKFNRLIRRKHTLSSEIESFISYKEISPKSVTSFFEGQTPNNQKSSSVNQKSSSIDKNYTITAKLCNIDRNKELDNIRNR